MQIVSQRWPFTTESSINEDDFNILDASPVRQLAWLFCKGVITWETMHVQAGDYYSQRRQWVKAGLEYRALIQATPISHSPYIYLGDALMRQQRFDAALETFRQSLEIQESAYAYKMMGRIYMMREDVAVAKVYFEKAVETAPDDIDAQFQLTEAYAMTGDFKKANLGIQRVLGMNGNHPGAKRLLEYVEQQFTR